MQEPPTRRRRGSLAWGALGVWIALSASGTVLYALVGTGGRSEELIFWLIVSPALPLMGALVASRQPANPIGWVMLGAGLATALALFASGYGEYGSAHPGSLPAVGPVAWVGVFGWLGFALPATFLLLLFPDGRLLSRRWRPAAWVSGAGVALSSLGLAFQPGTMEHTPVENPFGLESLKAAPAVAAGIGFPLVFFGALLGAVSLVLRYRRAGAEQRAQLKWLAYAATLLVAATVGGNTLTGGHITDHGVLDAVTSVLLFVGVPVAVAVAVLRYRLYDIELLIRRSVVYGSLWLLITLAYVGVAAALGVAAGQRLPTAVAILLTVLVTVVVQPARGRLERMADRWVFGKRVERYELLTQFGSILRDTFEPAQLGPRLAATVREGLSLRWVRVSLGDDLPVVSDGEDPGGSGAPAATAPLVDEGREVGRIDCGPKVKGELTDHDRHLLQTLAAQASLAARNARLAAELSRRLTEIQRQASELAASRARIVQAQDAERRRIERNIHDGAQQELVGLMAKLRLARNQLHGAPERADVTLRELQAETRLVLAGLRELAQGIHPSVLSDRGLVEAVATRTDRMPIPVELDVAARVREARFADEVEGAAYFVISEGLANVLKHSHATSASVRLTADDRWLRVEVTDTGVGFDVATVSGNGLANLSDRVAAVGGRMVVDGRAGAGTLLVAELPIRSVERAGG